jgi:thymidylate synthase
MTKGDLYTKNLIKDILENGRLDNNPRPHYEDGTSAHTLSVNHRMLTYDLNKGEFPLITLRPIATKSSIGELLWIYQDQTSNVYTLETKYGIRWWREWVINPFHYDNAGNLVEGANPNKEEGFYYDCVGSKIKVGEHTPTAEDKTDIDTNGNIVDYVRGNILTPDATIGSVYGYTISHYDLVNKLINGIKNDPDGRRHIINMWQEDMFKLPHGLKPCAFMTNWNVRHESDGDYLDMALYQRSSDFLTAGSINQTQYVIFQYLIARHLGYKPGQFTWMVDNIQIYDRHVEQGKIMLERTPVECSPKVWINPDKTDFFDMTVDDIKIIDYPLKEIKEVNPQLKFPIGI